MCYGMCQNEAPDGSCKCAGKGCPPQEEEKESKYFSDCCGQYIEENQKICPECGHRCIVILE